MNAAVAVEPEITPEDLLRIPERKHYELVDGRLVERTSSLLSCWVAVEILFLIRTFLEHHPIGSLFGADNGYQCFPGSPRKVRRPDVSFVRSERLPADWMTQGYAKVAPDLAVEVLSTNDLAIEVDRKVVEYQNAGVPLIWVVNPETRTVRIHRAGGSITLLEENDERSGEEVLPGFRCRVGSIFPPGTGVLTPSV